MKDEKVRERLNDTKFAEEVAVLNRFSEMFRTAPNRVAYGEKSVAYCLEQGAIDVLLVSDKLIRGKTADMRKRIIQLMDAVKESGGKSFLFSSLHPSGQQLNAGLQKRFFDFAIPRFSESAILRFPVEEQFDSESSSDEYSNEE